MATYKDTKARSWAKSVVWRVIGIVILGVISYLITGNWKQMTMITVLFHALRMILYYYHERTWERISWGRVMHPLCELPVRETPTPEDMEIIARKLRELGYMD